MTHTLFEALIAALPPEGAPLPPAKRAAALRTLDAMMDFVYIEPTQMTSSPASTEPLLLESPAGEVPPKTPAARVPVPAKAKGAHNGRHAFRDGVCTREGCTVRQPDEAARVPNLEPAASVRYCAIQGCHEEIVAGGRCADGHVQGGRG